MRQIIFCVTAIVTFIVAFWFQSARWIAPAEGKQTKSKEAQNATFPPASLIEPDQLVDILAHSKDKPPIVCVGFKILYDGAHIPGAVYLGPARASGGLDDLVNWAKDMPRSRTMVIYCGCCPWDKCPNIRPAYDALHKMGFGQIKLVHIRDSFAKDWVGRGFPVQKGK